MREKKMLQIARSFQRKKLLIIFTFLLFPEAMFGQWNPPDCSHLTVENIQLDSSNLIHITIRNNCTGCSSGIDGCIYLDLKVFRTVFPFDTLGAANCFCFWSPNNNSQLDYVLNSNVSLLPPLQEIRVSLFSGSCGCDTLPFSPTLSESTDAEPIMIQIFPNPFLEVVSITTLNQNLKGAEFVIKNILGQRVFMEQVVEIDTPYRKTVDLSRLKNGMYFLEMFLNGKRAVKKIIKS